MQIIPPSNQMTAVYLQDDGTLERSPVDFLYLSDEGEVTAGEFDSTGYAEIDIGQTANLIGFEHCGKEEDWTEAIKRKQAK